MKEATKATWIPRVADWKKSGKTAAEFAIGQPFTEGTLKWRARQLRRENSAAPTRRIVEHVDKMGTKVVLAEVVRRAPEARNSDLMLEVASVRIRVNAGFDKGLLREVVFALQQDRT